MADNPINALTNNEVVKQGNNEYRRTVQHLEPTNWRRQALWSHLHQLPQQILQQDQQCQALLQQVPVQHQVPAVVDQDTNGRQHN